MCLYPVVELNRRYIPNKKNGGIPPPLTDIREKYVMRDCGTCIDCRKKKSREWAIRLENESRYSEKPLFITLTFGNNSLKRIEKNVGYVEYNRWAGYAIRHWLERVRKATKRSIKHWMIAELGGEYGRLHLHGLVWCEDELIRQTWKYGHVWIGEYRGLESVRYLTKYMTKVNNENDFKSKIWCSPGLGKAYVEQNVQSILDINSGQKKIEYVLEDGRRMNMPNYYKRKIFQEDNITWRWKDSMNDDYVYVCGRRIKKVDIQGINDILRTRRLFLESIGEGIRNIDYTINEDNYKDMLNHQHNCGDNVMETKKSRIDKQKKIKRLRWLEQRGKPSCFIIQGERFPRQLKLNL